MSCGDTGFMLRRHRHVASRDLDAFGPCVLSNHENEAKREMAPLLPIPNGARHQAEPLGGFAFVAIDVMDDGLDRVHGATIFKRIELCQAA